MSNPTPRLSNLKPYTGTWRHGETRTIRVPVVLSDAVLRFARSLDDESFTNRLTQVIDDLKYLESTPRNNFSRDRKAKLKESVDILTKILSLYSLDTSE